jgi:ankyrin repeat protein
MISKFRWRSSRSSTNAVSEQRINNNKNNNVHRSSASEFLHAAAEGSITTLQRCLAEGVNVTTKDSDGLTALHFASGNGCLEVVKYLLQQNGSTDVEATDNEGQTALHFACSNGHLGVVTYLVGSGHAMVEAESSTKKTALHTASENGYLEVVKYLIEDGNASVEAKDNCRWTALHYASLCGHLDIVKFLIENGNANIEARNNFGKTPLHVASGFGNLKIVQYLVDQCGADVDSLNAKRKTPLNLAKEKGKRGVVEYLSKVMNITDKEGPSQPVPLLPQQSSTTIDATINLDDVLCMRNTADVVSNRQELERMIHDPTLEPTIWTLEYLQQCTNNFTSKVLGEGAFGKVYFGCDKVLGRQFAVKRVPLIVPDEDVLEQITLSFKREISVRTFCWYGDFLIYHSPLMICFYIHYSFHVKYPGVEKVSTSKYCYFIWFQHYYSTK